MAKGGNIADESKQLTAEELTIQLTTAIADLNTTLDTAEKQLTHLRSLRATLNASVSDHEQRMGMILNQPPMTGLPVGAHVLGRR